MNIVSRTLRGPGDQLPWFRARPRLTVAVAAALFGSVFVLRLYVGQPVDVVNMLYTLPIALLAVAFGRRHGVAAGVFAVVLVGTWAVVCDVDLSPLGWVSRALPLLLLGALLGDASDRLSAVNASRRLLEASAQRQRDAAEVNDTLIQGMAAAAWSLEAGRVDAGLATLRETLELGHELVSKLLRDADMGIGGSHRPPGPE